MNKKIVFPTNEAEGLRSRRGAHFGRANFYTVVEIDASGSVTDVTVVKNGVAREVSGLPLPPNRPRSIVDRRSVCGMVDGGVPGHIRFPSGAGSRNASRRRQFRHLLGTV